MKIPFYILGLLQQCGPQHGYSLKQIMEERISDFAKIKLPTIYYHLDKLKEKGYVTETVDKDGNRPEKLVYSITSSGAKYFDTLFFNMLSESYSPEFSLDGVFYFREKMNTAELIQALQDKKQELLLKLQNVEMHKVNTLNFLPKQAVFNATTIFDHHICHFKAELQWLENTIKGLSE